MKQISRTCPSIICQYRDVFGYCTVNGPCVMVETKVAIPVKEPEIIRCKDCMFYESGENEVDSWRLCARHASNVEPDGYCAWACKKGTGGITICRQEDNAIPADKLLF